MHWWHMLQAQAGLEVILNRMPLDLMITKHSLLGYLRVKRVLGISWPGVGFGGKRGFMLSWSKMADKVHVEKIVEECIPMEFRWDRHHSVGKPHFEDQDNIKVFIAFRTCNAKIPIVGTHTDVYLGNSIKPEIQKSLCFSGILPAHAIKQCLANLLVMIKSGAVLTGMNKVGSLDIYFKGPNISLRKQLLNSSYDLQVVDSLEQLKEYLGVTPNLMPNSCWKNWHWLAKFKFNRALAYAKLASRCRATQTRLDMAAPRGTLSRVVNDHFFRKWSTIWQNTDSDKYRQTRFWFPNGPRPDISKALVMKSRTTLGTYIQFLTGHGWLNRHRWIVDPERQFRPSTIDPMCLLCGNGEETPEHLWSCVELQDGVIPRNNPWQLKELDRFLGTTTMILLLKHGQGEQEL